MVALPDFAFSGMENWGIIMYREAALLYKPNASSEANKQRTAGILSHELAHQVCYFIREESQGEVALFFFRCGRFFSRTSNQARYALKRNCKVYQNMR